MFVALDGQLTIGTPTGIGEYVRGLAPALRRQGITVAELCEPRLNPWRFDRRIVWDQLLLPLRSRASGADLLHCASGTMPYAATLPTVVTVHDVAWFKAQRHTRAYARWYFGAFSLRRYSRARAVVVDSAFSRDELLGVARERYEALALHPERIHVVYPGVAQEFLRLQRAPDPQPFVLVPGTVERRKNLEVLLRALTRSPNWRILSVGPLTPYHRECVDIARRLGVAERVEFRGYVGQTELLQLFSTCAAVAVPSTYEGFGYAAAQALCAGVPLIVSDRSSLPEIAGSGGAVVRWSDESAWAAEISRVIDNPAAAQAQAAAVRDEAAGRFAWATAAAALGKIYRSVLKGAAEV